MEGNVPLDPRILYPIRQMFDNLIVLQARKHKTFIVHPRTKQIDDMVSQRKVFLAACLFLLVANIKVAAHSSYILPLKCYHIRVSKAGKG